MNNVPVVKVGIMNEPIVNFILNGEYVCNGTVLPQGELRVCIDDGKILLDNAIAQDEFMIEPTNLSSCSFDLIDVTIGVNFHWERKENQRFKGALKLIQENGRVTPINILPVEDYLLSVISSEMSATSSLELLKAHAVISRSWLLAQIKKKEKSTTLATTPTNNADELIKWYDREDHENFDVCADDHCQRYQGITRESTATVVEAIDATWGEVLMYEGQLCDTRFSKSCGGVFEEFENCWEPVHHNYLEARSDTLDEEHFPDLTIEENAVNWIMSSPASFCNTHDTVVLQQVLNNYDQETPDFYRWHVEYSQDELSQLIRDRSGIDFGRIIDLQPVARGTSGRLYKLRIVGEKRTMVIGKELEIRRTLSRSHLYSSAFVVEKQGTSPDGCPLTFILHGAGWGHGVGLCQIGAAVMGQQGYSYRQILAHYFKDAQITELYGK